MNAIYVKHVPKFKDEDVVLLAVDEDGLEVFVAALEEALRHGAGRLQRRARSHRFLIAERAADITISDECVTWRLDRSKASEIICKAQTLDTDGHHYVDEMQAPAPTLVISLNEYITPTWLTEGREPIFTAEDPD